MPCKDKTEARKIAKKLVEQKLAICINIIDPIESIYRWKGQVRDCKESLLIIKTSSKLLEQVINKVKELHSYNLPDIISWKIDKTTSEVEKWVKRELK